MDAPKKPELTAKTDCQDEKNGLTYSLVGDYYLPNITNEEKRITLGIWARKRLEYLKRHKRILYLNLITTDNLSKHLKEVDEQVGRLFEELTLKMMNDEGVNEELKRSDRMLWVGRMNNIRHRAKEIVDYEVVYR